MELFSKFIKSKKNRVGMDIGSYSVKSVELFSGKKENLKIKGFGYAVIENPANRENIIRAIKKSAGQANVLGKEACVAVSGPSVIVRFLELPRMTEEELKSAIPFEAEKYIPFNISEVIIDHQLLIPRLGNNLMLVLLVAAKKDYISERMSLLNEAGISTGILDVTSFANVNAFLHKASRKDGGISALIDIGATAMEINIIDGDILYFTRNIQLGGADITKALSETLSLDLPSAEKVKLNPADKAAFVREKIKPILRSMIDETRLSFSYYENQSGKSIEKVYLSGGSCKIANSQDIFKENLGIEVVLWNPIESLEVGNSVDAESVASVKSQLGVAIGLAFR